MGTDPQDLVDGWLEEVALGVLRATRDLDLCGLDGRLPGDVSIGDFVGALRSRVGLRPERVPEVRIPEGIRYITCREWLADAARLLADGHRLVPADVPMALLVGFDDIDAGVWYGVPVSAVRWERAYLSPEERDVWARLRGVR